MSDKKRVNFAGPPGNRDSAASTGRQLINLYKEESPRGTRVVKRPGTLPVQEPGDCTGQGIVFFADTAITISCDTLNIGTAMYIACGIGGQIYKSLDAATWTLHSTLTTDFWYDVTFTGQHVVVVGEDSGPAGGIISYSTDGENFTSATNPLAGSYLKTVTYANSVAMAGTFEGGEIAISTDDGVTWSAATSLVGVLGPGVITIQSMAGNPSGRFVVVGFHEDGVGGPVIPFMVYSDNNGTSWTACTWPNVFPNILYSSDICWGDSGFVAVGHGSTNNATIMLSADGITFTEQTSPVFNSGYNAVTFGGSQYVAHGIPTGGPFTAFAATSPDGVTWTSRTPDNFTPIGSTAGGPAYVVAGRIIGLSPTGRLSTSTDGITWSLISPSPTYDMHGVAYGSV